jgi:hypothetical protein
MNSQEELWFELPTWNHERGTTKVAIIFQQKAPLKQVFPMITDYLKSIGFSLKRPDFVPRNASGSVLLVDLVDKNIDIISNLEYKVLNTTESIEKAVPSQLQPYMQNNKGMLTGKRYGL